MFRAYDWDFIWRAYRSLCLLISVRFIVANPSRAALAARALSSYGYWRVLSADATTPMNRAPLTTRWHCAYATDTGGGGTRATIRRTRPLPHLHHLPLHRTTAPWRYRLGCARAGGIAGESAFARFSCGGGGAGAPAAHMPRVVDSRRRLNSSP